MRDWKTTLAGAATAAIIAIQALPNHPGTVPKLQVILIAVGVALLGFFAKDATTPLASVPVRVGVLLCAGALVVLAGCTISQLQFAVTNPTFGSLDLSIGGGSVGNRPNTNFTAVAKRSSATATSSTNSVNQAATATSTKGKQ
jgi:Na+/phosphate symporter